MLCTYSIKIFTIAFAGKFYVKMVALFNDLHLYLILFHPITSKV